MTITLIPVAKNALTVSVKIFDAFLDRAAVTSILKTMNKEVASVLREAGKMIRKTARNSMKKRKSAAMPGNPPSWHPRAKGDRATLKNILYGLANDNNSVRIGPLGFNLRRSRGTLLLSKSVPEIHEFGGTLYTVREVPIHKRGPRKKPATEAQKIAFKQRIAAGLVKKRPNQIVEKVAKYPARPFMRPALAENLPKLPNLWSDSIR